MARELALITGVSGHVGFRVLATALAAGYYVRATVRKEAQIDTIRATKSIKPYLSNLEIVVVPDILKDGAFDAALKDVTYIIHIASPLAQKTDSPERDIIEPAIKATVNILASAQKFPGIKRIVITSSLAAIGASSPEDKTTVFNETNIVPRPSPPYGSYFEAYRNSKALAYYATLDWIEDNKPTFDVINIHPAFVIGANELSTTVDEMVAGSNGIALRPLLGMKVDQPMKFATVHVDDVATAHVKALDPVVKGGQSFLLAIPKQTGAWDDGIEATKKLFPGAEGKLPLNGTQPTATMLLDTSKATEELGIQFKSFDEQIKSLASHLLELKSSP